MASFTHKFLALTNILGLVPMFYSHTWSDSCVVLATIVASVAMHACETKHKLNPGKSFAKYGDLFLNIDRAMAMIAMSYLFPKWWHLDYAKKVDVLALFCGGLLFSAVGELTESVKLYIICHTFWHIIVYTSMYLILT